jgi:hypothetical protein
MGARSAAPTFCVCGKKFSRAKKKSQLQYEQCTDGAIYCVEQCLMAWDLFLVEGYYSYGLLVLAMVQGICHLLVQVL